MTGNRSLDEFLNTGADEAHAAEPEAASFDPDSAEGRGDPSPAEPDPTEAVPIETTRSWSPDGAACDACGAVVEERWRGDDGLVCAACKEW